MVTVTLPRDIPSLQIMAAAYSDAGQMIACTLPEQSEGAAIQTFPFSGENVRLFFLGGNLHPLFPVLLI